MPNPLEQVYKEKVKIRKRLADTSDGNVRFVVTEGLWGRDVDVLERHLISSRGLDPTAAAPSLRKFSWERWRKTVQGRGADSFTGQRSNGWIRGGHLWPSSGRDFVDMVKLRTQTLPCGESMVRGRGKVIPLCRHCGDSSETLVHVLQKCPFTLKLRMRRHNRVLQVVRRSLKKAGCAVYSEPRVLGRNDTILRPDLCAKGIGGGALVLDAHIPYELGGPSQLEAARSAKAAKYAAHRDGFRRYLGVEDIRFDGVVVGARGAIAPPMVASLKGLGLSDNEIRLMQVRAVEGTLSIFRSFMAEKRRLTRPMRTGFGRGSD